MKKIFALCTFAITFSLQCFAQNDVEKILLADKLEILVPQGFTRIPIDRFESHLPGVLPTPLWMISYDNGKVRLSCTHTDKKADDNGIPGFTDQLIADLKAGRKDFKLVDDGILLKDGKNIGYIKFISQVKDQKAFSYIFYISLEEILVLFSFDCPKKLRKKWESKAGQMAASLHLLL